MREVPESVLELNQAEVDYEELIGPSVQTESEESAIQEERHEFLSPGVMVGTLAGFDEAGAPLVTFGNGTKNGPVEARSTVGLTVTQIGHEVALAFEQGDFAKPIILGCIYPKAATNLVAKLDGKQVVLSAEREIVLRCGKSSITLTRAGKVIIRGAYLLSRSSGANRIKGGSVQIN